MCSAYVELKSEETEESYSSLYNSANSNLIVIS